MPRPNQLPCQGAACACCARPTALAQSLDELDFARSAGAAASVGDVARLARLLALKPGRAVESSTGGGHTPLHYACRGGHAACVRLLLQHGADVDVVTTEGRATPLHRAATAGSGECVALLCVFDG